jgi:hypothetical protein
MGGKNGDQSNSLLQKFMLMCCSPFTNNINGTTTSFRVQLGVSWSTEFGLSLKTDKQDPYRSLGNEDPIRDFSIGIGSSD